MLIDLEPPYLIIKPDVTEEDFYRLADEDSDWEYLDGRLVMHSPASNRHEDLFSFLSALLRNFLDETGRGVVRGSRYPMRLDPRWSPEPDLLVVLSEREHLLGRQRLEGPADFVIEITSESDPTLDYREKLPRYREARVGEIWIVNHIREEVLVETKTPSGYASRTVSAGVVGSTVLPGFRIEVSSLWGEKLPSTVRLIQEMLGR